MAAAKRTTSKAEAQPEPEVAPVTDHGSPDHDWRNPEARFAADDNCINARLRRLAPQ